MSRLDVGPNKLRHDHTLDPLASIVGIADLFRTGAIKDWPHGFILSVEKPDYDALKLLANFVTSSARVSHNSDFVIEDLSNSTAIHFAIKRVVPDPEDRSRTLALIPNYDVSVTTGQNKATHSVFVTGGTDIIHIKVLSEIRKLLSA